MAQKKHTGWERKKKRKVQDRLTRSAIAAVEKAEKKAK